MARSTVPQGQGWRSLLLFPCETAGEQWCPRIAIVGIGTRCFPLALLSVSAFQHSFLYMYHVITTCGVALILQPCPGRDTTGKRKDFSQSTFSTAAVRRGRQSWPNRRLQLRHSTLIISCCELLCIPRHDHDEASQPEMLTTYSYKQYYGPSTRARPPLLLLPNPCCCVKGRNPHICRHIDDFVRTRLLLGE